LQTGDVLEGLNPEQMRAVGHPGGPLMVVAGPGSGKTRVVTRRIAFLVTRGVPPRAILAVTFTNKAADEMRSRLDKLGVPQGVTASTFHSFCANVLRRNAERVGLDSNYTIYDSADSLRQIKNVLTELNLSEEHFRPQSVARAISNAKSSLTPPNRYEKRHSDQWGRNVAQIYARYEEALRRANALDFDDLLLKTVELLERDLEVRNYYQGRYMHVLVDEYQDTNLLQHMIVRYLSEKHRNITVVGDSDQMIYGWRGADIRSMLDFEKHFPELTTVILDRNYRSTSRILRVASELISHNKERHPKTLRTENPEGEKPVICGCETPEDEAAKLVRRIETLRQRGVKLSDMAVFYRGNAQSRTIEAEFQSNLIPYEIVQGTAFFERKEVKDLRAYLQLAANPMDDVSFARVVNVPPRGLGNKSVETLQSFARTYSLSMLQAASRADQIADLSARAAGTLKGFAEWMTGLSQENPRQMMPFLKKIVNQSGYLKNIEKKETDEARDSADIVNELLNYATEYDARSLEPSLTDFLSRMSLVSDVDSWGEQADAVSLMTLHASKGLEFRAVFIVGVEEEVLPHVRSSPDSDASGLEEERRLFHVGITRAKEFLWISYCEERMSQGRFALTGPSRFIEELPEDEVEYAEGGSSSAGARSSRGGYGGGYGGGRGAWSFGGREGGYGRSRGGYARPSYGDDDRRSRGGRGGGYSGGGRREIEEDDFTDDADGEEIELPGFGKFRMGETVAHPDFGEGKVAGGMITGSGPALIVNFKGVGRRTVLLSYTKLTRRKT